VEDRRPVRGEFGIGQELLYWNSRSFGCCFYGCFSFISFKYEIQWQ